MIILRNKTLFLGLMILAAALSRLLPHPYNFTPIGAMGLFGAAYFTQRYLAFLVPLAALWVSDLLLNNLIYARQYPEFYQDGFVWLPTAYASYVYIAFLCIVLIGFVFLRQVRPSNLLATSLLASITFFLITNAGSWMIDPAYPKNSAGLLAAYTAGIPFFWNTLLGDLFYVALLFGVFEWVKYTSLKSLAVKQAKN
ncbi:MAG TPA: hypothetical protein PKA00_10635 [Saprospiraceae bacterium]|nr:hypothetical protein [Saprospiraceae bacterium]HMQ83357.1 hypothetical protein [Saprospiraceae bacterium]